MAVQAVLHPSPQRVLLYRLPYRLGPYRGWHWGCPPSPRQVHRVVVAALLLLLLGPGLQQQRQPLLLGA